LCKACKKAFVNSRNGQASRHETKYIVLLVFASALLRTYVIQINTDRIEHLYIIIHILYNPRRVLISQGYEEHTVVVVKMPLCTVHLIALHTTTPDPLSTFLTTLKSSNVSPLVVSRVIRWIILPSHISTENLLARNIHWDLFLILPSTSAIPPNIEKLVQYHWTITAGVPSRLIQDFAQKNGKLLHPDPSSIPKLDDTSTSPSKTTASSQNLELSAGLEAWIEKFASENRPESNGAVSMFNLLSFNPGMKSKYLKYGKAFAETIGSRHGGNAKIVGNVVASPNSNGSSVNDDVVDAGQDGWDEIALAHYPSIRHFRDMLVSDDYQEVNHKHRVGSLKDTCILMTSEVGIEAWRERGAKL
jgi:hypothetical protein